MSLVPSIGLGSETGTGLKMVRMYADGVWVHGERPWTQHLNTDPPPVQMLLPRTLVITALLQLRDHASASAITAEQDETQVV